MKTIKNMMIFLGVISSLGFMNRVSAMSSISLDARDVAEDDTQPRARGVQSQPRLCRPGKPALAVGLLPTFDPTMSYEVPGGLQGDPLLGLQKGLAEWSKDTAGMSPEDKIRHLCGLEKLFQAAFERCSRPGQSPEYSGQCAELGNQVVALKKQYEREIVDVYMAEQMQLQEEAKERHHDAERLQYYENQQLEGGAFADARPASDDDQLEIARAESRAAHALAQARPASDEGLQRIAASEEAEAKRRAAQVRVAPVVVPVQAPQPEPRRVDRDPVIDLAAPRTPTGWFKRHINWQRAVVIAAGAAVAAVAAWCWWKK